MTTAAVPNPDAIPEIELRARIRDEIALIEPMDDLEREHRATALAWIDSGVELCRREKPATPPMHLVSYFVVIDVDHVLLVDHRNAQRWLPTGGHVEPGEHPRATVRRELREELGLSPTHEIAPPGLITCTTTVGATAGHTDVSLWYVIRVARDQQFDFDREEFADARWFAFDQAPRDRVDPHLHRFLAKLRAWGDRLG